MADSPPAITTPGSRPAVPLPLLVDTSLPPTGTTAGPGRSPGVLIPNLEAVTRNLEAVTRSLEVVTRSQVEGIPRLVAVTHRRVDTEGKLRRVDLPWVDPLAEAAAATNVSENSVRQTCLWSERFG
eukprot:Hpha_TRINITY_DN16156_c5_g4::TRINITY_DN16156_c5_g4_i1::g.3496::m.3496